MRGSWQKRISVGTPIDWCFWHTCCLLLVFFKACLWCDSRNGNISLLANRSIRCFDPYWYLPTTVFRTSTNWLDCFRRFWVKCLYVSWMNCHQIPFWVKGQSLKLGKASLLLKYRKWGQNKLFFSKIFLCQSMIKIIWFCLVKIRILFWAFSVFLCLQE